MSDPTTLHEYYTNKGKVLPTLSTRGGIFEQMGLGLAASYTGTAVQNNMLLAALLEADINHDKLIASPDLDTTSLLLPPDLIEYSGGALSVPLSSADQNKIRQVFAAIADSIPDSITDMKALAENIIFYLSDPAYRKDDFLTQHLLEQTEQILQSFDFEQIEQDQTIQDIQQEVYTPTELTWNERYGSSESPAYDYDSDTDHWTIAGTTPDKLDNISPEDTKFYVGEDRDEMLDQVSNQTTKTVFTEFIATKTENGLLSLFTRSETLVKLKDTLKSNYNKLLYLMDKGADMIIDGNMSTSKSEQFWQEVEDSEIKFKEEVEELEISEIGTEGGVLNKILSSVRTIIRHSDTQFIVEDASLIPQYQTPDGHHVEIIGAAAGDVLYGGNGNDTLIGQYNSDKLVGGSGNDFVIGGDGNDNLDGSEGDDILVSGSDNDVLHAGFGLDDLTGGGGNDSFSFYAAGDFTVQDFNKSVDLLVFESTTGLHNIGDLVSVITSIEDNSEGVTIHFVDDIASITLIGLHQDDLSGDMVAFA